MKIVYTENYEFGGLERFLFDLLRFLGPEDVLLVFNAGNERVRNFALENGFRFVEADVKRRHLPYLDRVGWASFISRAAALMRRHYCLLMNYAVLKRLFSGLPSPEFLYIVNGGHPGADSCRSAAIAAGSVGWQKVFYCVLSSPTEIRLPPFRQLEKLADNLLFSAVSETHVNSAAIRDALLQRLAPSFPEIRVVHTGVPMPREVVRSAAVGGPRARVTRSGDEVWVATVSALFPLKGNDTVLEAVRMASARDPRIKWLLAGDGPELGRLRAAAADMGLGGRVVFTGRYPGDIGEVYRFADIFAFASKQEGLPYVVSEAMSNALPVVATSVGGIPEQVSDGETGFLVPPGSPASMAEKISLLAGDPGLRCRMGEAGRRKAGEMFSETAMRAALSASWGRPGSRDGKNR